MKNLKGHNSAIKVRELWLLFFAPLLMVVSVRTKFLENILNPIKNTTVGNQKFHSSFHLQTSFNFISFLFGI